jgi:hypothetical protein
MAKHIISAEGLAVVAEKEDLYTVIAGSDGYDYIVELVNGAKVWKSYMPHDEEEEDLPVVEDKPVLLEDIMPPVSQEKTKKGATSAAPKKKGRKPKVQPPATEDSQEGEDAKPHPIEKKPAVKKKISVPVISSQEKLPVVADDTTSAEDNAVVVETKKKVAKKKPLEDGVEKKLSEYHLFIREFLSKNADIVWSERMKAANAAYKAHKESIETKG